MTEEYSEKMKEYIERISELMIAERNATLKRALHHVEIMMGYDDESVPEPPESEEQMSFFEIYFLVSHVALIVSLVVAILYGIYILVKWYQDYTED